MKGSLTLPRLTGCPCGHLYDDECVTRTPLPIADPAPCDYRCRSWGLAELQHFARELGVCPCNLERNPNR